jgi:hypothetical protein
VTPTPRAIGRPGAFVRRAGLAALVAASLVFAACNGRAPDRAASAVELRNDATSARFAHPPPFESPSKAAAARGAGGASSEDMARLEKQVARLEHDVAALRAEVASGSGAPRAQPDLLDRRQTAAIEAAFRDEALDPSWSASMTETVRAVLAQGSIEHGAARSVECRSHSCRVDFGEAGASAAEPEIVPLLARLAPSLPRAQEGQVQMADGRQATVLYLSR